MNKAEYMKELIEKLNGFDEELVQEIVSDYEEHFANGAEKGKSEEEVITELGSVDELLDELQEFQRESAKQHVKMPIKNQEKENGVWETQFAVPAEVIASEELKKKMEEATREAEQTMETPAWEEALRKMQESVDKIDWSVADAMQKLNDAVNSVDWDGTWNRAKAQVKNAAENIDVSAIGETFANMGLAIANAVMGKRSNHEEEEYDEENREEELEEEPEELEEELEDLEEESEDIDEEDWAEEENLEEENGPALQEWVSEPKGDTPTEKCKKLVIDGKFADVYLEGTDEHEIRVEYENHGSLKDAMKYPFYSYQKEGTFYAGIKMNKEKKSSFFRFNSSEPQIELKIKVPKNMQSVEVQTVSGEMKAVQLVCDSVKLASVSGDARLNTIHCKNFKMESVSGDIAVREVTGETVQASSVSGDVTVWASAKKYDFSTTSGELMVRFDEVAETRISVVSGSCELEMPKSEEGYTIRFNSVSGSCDVNKEELCTEIKENNRPGHRSREMRVGNGQHSVSIQSISGNTTIKVQ